MQIGNETAPVSPPSSLNRATGEQVQVYYLSKKVTVLEGGLSAIKLKVFHAGLSVEKIQKLELEKRFALVKERSEVDGSEATAAGLPALGSGLTLALDEEWQRRWSGHKITQVVLQQKGSASPVGPDEQVWHAGASGSLELRAFNAEESWLVHAWVAQVAQLSAQLKSEAHKESPHHRRGQAATPPRGNAVASSDQRRHPPAALNERSKEYCLSRLNQTLVLSAMVARDKEERKASERLEKAEKLKERIVRDEVAKDEEYAEELKADLQASALKKTLLAQWYQSLWP